ncbi:MAG: hypothetical protein AB1Z57_03680 [Acidimicrobiia bacterium]
MTLAAAIATLVAVPATAIQCNPDKICIFEGHIGSEGDYIVGSWSIYSDWPLDIRNDDDSWDNRRSVRYRIYDDPGAVRYLYCATPNNEATIAPAVDKQGEELRTASTC